ncbi:MAG TPA: NAD(P)-dependent oxidoreductase [Ignavibacteria bacterium]|nr:NAD(P)-dependent oxidoreductase [Ignavibacteria bacterium]HMR40366.1 NAD(P)-dependent oxidoreductase [Ignavibacteria bacterium]
MAKLKILIADEIDKAGLKQLPGNKFNAEIKFGISNSEIISKYSSFDILVIRSIRKIDKEFIRDTNFKVIATCSKGTDHIDTEYAKKKKILILNAEDSNNISAAEHTLGLIIAAEKKILFSDNLVRKGKFNFYDFERSELKGKKIGIIGFGKVGSYVGKLSEAFGMKIYANDTDKNVRYIHKKTEFKSLNFILRSCDIVTVHIPLSKKNYKFISKEKLNLLNENSLFVNTSRGDVVDELHLINLLRNKKIKFAALDVFNNEPFVNKDLTGLDNVILTNHIAGKTMQSRRKISENIFGHIKNLKLSMQK